MKLDEYGGVGVIAPEGAFAGPAVATVRRALAERFKNGAARVVFDLSATTFIDGQGLEALTSAAAHCRSLGGKVVLAAAGETCRKILEMTRLDNCFESYPDAAAALKAANGR